MADGYQLLQLFYDLPEAEVLALRDKALASLSAQTEFMQVTAGGKSGTKEWTLPPKYALLECRAALRHINPAVYGRRRRRIVSRVPSCQY